MDILDRLLKHDAWTTRQLLQRCKELSIAHLITHSLTPRVEILHMLQRLGLRNLLEGDVLSWEEQDRRARGIEGF